MRVEDFLTADQITEFNTFDCPYIAIQKAIDAASSKDEAIDKIVLLAKKYDVEYALNNKWSIVQWPSNIQQVEDADYMQRAIRHAAFCSLERWHEKLSNTQPLLLKSIEAIYALYPDDIAAACVILEQHYGDLLATY